MRRPERAGGGGVRAAAVRSDATPSPDGMERAGATPPWAGARSAGSASGPGHGRSRLGALRIARVDLTQIDLRASLLGKTMRPPLLISSMTGGMPRAEAINRHLSEAAQALGIAMGVGSQRVSLQSRNSQGLTRSLRRLAPDVQQPSQPLGEDYTRTRAARWAATMAFCNDNRRFEIDRAGMALARRSSQLGVMLALHLY